MQKVNDSLRGYSHNVHKRDHFVCRYCGLDGTLSFANWLAPSWDHLLPTGDPNRDNEDFIVTACLFCNGADNRYFDHTKRRNGFGQPLATRQPSRFIQQRHHAPSTTP